jgi:hypothetical protein
MRNNRSNDDQYQLGGNWNFQPFFAFPVHNFLKVTDVKLEQ